LTSHPSHHVTPKKSRPGAKVYYDSEGAAWIQTTPGNSPTKPCEFLWKRSPELDKKIVGTAIVADETAEAAVATVADSAATDDTAAVSVESTSDNIENTDIRKKTIADPAIAIVASEATS